MKRHGISKKDLEFGQIVLVKNKLIRREIYQPDVQKCGCLKTWQEHPHKEFKPQQGIFLGYRTVSDGRRYIYSDHIEYHAKRHYCLALVAVDEHTNPFYTDQLEKID